MANRRRTGRPASGPEIVAAVPGDRPLYLVAVDLDALLEGEAFHRAAASGSWTSTPRPPATEVA